jgi:hypothetical protein
MYAHHAPLTQPVSAPERISEAQVGAGAPPTALAAARGEGVADADASGV